MKKSIRVFFILALSISFVSCKTANQHRAYYNAGLMYAMIYDHDNNPVNSVTIYVDNKKYVEADIQGRFILDLKKNGEYLIKLTKKGFEDIDQTFQFDPMNVLYFKMINTSQLLQLAEDAMDKYHYNEAETFLKRALIIEQSRPDVLYLLTIALHLQSKTNEAKEVLETLIDLGFTDTYVIELLKKISE